MDKRIIALTALVLFMTSIAFAYTLSGDSVYEDDGVSRISVTPATAYSPIAQDLPQTFDLWNKTASDQLVYVAYRYALPLASGKVEVPTQAVYSWIENQSYTCGSPNKYTYTLNKYPAQQNPHYLYCYRTMDNNTPANPNDDYNVKIADYNFSRGDLATNTIYITNYVMTSQAGWSDVSNAFSQYDFGGRIYYTPTPVTIKAGEHLTWKLTYTPNPLDTTKKWEMAYYTGASAGCILDNTCTYVNWLDPWWDTTWLFKKQITLTAPSDKNVFTGDIVSFTMNTQALISASKLQSDCDDLRILFNDNNVQDMNVWNCNTTSTRINFRYNKTRLAPNGTDNNIFIYYGNSGASRFTSNGDFNNMDDLESGVSSPIWSVSGMTISGSYARYGSYGIGGTTTTTASAQTANYTNAGIKDFNFWINATAGANSSYLIYKLDGSSCAFGNTNELELGIQRGANHKLVWFNYKDSASTNGVIYGTTTDGNWYRINTTFDYTNGVITMKAYNYGDALLGTQTASFNVTKGVTSVCLMANDNTAGYDNLTYNAKQIFANNTTLGGEQTSADVNVTFNVKTLSGSHLTAVNMDVNVNTYDLNNQNSPFSEMFVNGSYTATFSRAGFDNNTNFPIVADANKSYTIYLNDQIPQVGKAQIFGFTINGGYINGTGYALADVNDAGTGIDPTTCEYSIDGIAWLPALDGNTAFCRKNNITITNGTSYAFKFRVKDNSGGQGTGTADDNSPHTGDTIAPTTTLTSSQVVGFSIATIHLTCTDAGSGCNSTTYRVDSGAWNAYTSDFNILNGGTHTIDFNSRDNVNNIETINTQSITITGTAHFYFFDENSGATLTGITSIFNGNSYSSGATNRLDLNLAGITTNDYTFTFSATGYSTRYYQELVSATTDLNKNFALAPTSMTEDVGFKMYQTDQISLYTNTYVELLDKDTNYTIGKLKTDATGNTTFNIKTNDNNYWVVINNGTAVYTPVVLTILKPIDEQTLLPIASNWRVDITQNFYASYTNITNSKIVYLLPDTSLPYNIQIQDMNNQYFPRNYAQMYLGNPSTATLQPYLISDLNGLVTTLHAVSSYTNQPVSGVIIKVYKLISSLGLVYVEQDITDSKGEALTMLLLNGQYQFQIYFNGNFLRTDTINSPTANIYIKIPDLAVTEPTYGQMNIDINYAPNTGAFSVRDTALTQVVTITDFNSTTTISQVYFRVYSGGRLLGENIVPFSSTMTNSWVIDPTGETINGVAYDENEYIFVDTIVQASDGNHYFHVVYKPYTGLNIFDNLGMGARSVFGGDPTNPLIPSPALLFLGITISLLATIGIAQSSGFMSLHSVAGIFLLVAGFFTYLAWIPYVLYFIMVASTGAFYLVKGWIR